MPEYPPVPTTDVLVQSPTPPPLRPALEGASAAILTAVLLLATEPYLAIAWDEGYTLGRVERVRSWLRAMRDPAAFARSWERPEIESVQDRMPPPDPSEFDTRGELLSGSVLAWFWPFGREEPHGHPPFYAIVALAGDALTPWRDALPRARLGTMLAFSLAAGALFAACRRRWGPWPASAATAAFVLQPRLFAEAHYATYDALLTSIWVGAILAFAAAVEGAGRKPRRGWAVAFGVLAGWAADTKLTGWFLPLPFAAWVVMRAISRRDSRRGLVTLLVGGAVAVVTLYVFNPPWWPDPFSGVARFFASNLSRGRTIPIQTMFLGTVYNTPIESLPWYNTLAWTLFVTPLGFLALAIAGAFGCLIRAGRTPDPSSSPLPALALLHAAFFLTLRALPHTPGHDGIRQFLPAFGCLAILVAPGVAWISERSARAARALAGLAIAEGVLSVAVMMPVPLSYYSPVIGGLPGAARLGMEPTYYWDALDARALDWLNRRTPRARSVLFATNPTSWFYLQETGQLQAAIAPFDRRPPIWYVVQNRPGAMRPADRHLVESVGDRHVIASKLGVPLVWAFPIEDFERALAASEPRR